MVVQNMMWTGQLTLSQCTAPNSAFGNSIHQRHCCLSPPQFLPNTDDVRAGQGEMRKILEKGAPNHMLFCSLLLHSRLTF